MSKSNLCPPQFPYHCNKKSPFRTRSNGKPSQGNASHCVQKKSMCKKSFSKVRSMMKKHRPVSKKDWHNGKPRVKKVAKIDNESSSDEESDEEMEMPRQRGMEIPRQRMERGMIQDMIKKRDMLRQPLAIEHLKELEHVKRPLMLEERREPMKRPLMLEDRREERREQSEQSVLDQILSQRRNLKPLVMGQHEKKKSALEQMLEKRRNMMKPEDDAEEWEGRKRNPKSKRSCKKRSMKWVKSKRSKSYCRKSNSKR